MRDSRQISAMCFRNSQKAKESICVCAWVDDTAHTRSICRSNRFCFIHDDRTNSFILTLSISNALDKDSVIFKDLTNKAIHLYKYEKM